MALGRHFADQLRRLTIPVGRGHRFLFGVTLIEKDGKWGYRVIRKSHSNWSLPQWKGTTTTVDMQIHETPTLRFKSAETALASAEQWLAEYSEGTRQAAEAAAASVEDAAEVVEEEPAEV